MSGSIFQTTTLSREGQRKPSAFADGGKRTQATSTASECAIHYTIALWPQWWCCCCCCCCFPCLCWWNCCHLCMLLLSTRRAKASTNLQHVKLLDWLSKDLHLRPASPQKKLTLFRFSKEYILVVSSWL